MTSPRFQKRGKNPLSPMSFHSGMWSCPSDEFDNDHNTDMGVFYTEQDTIGIPYTPHGSQAAPNFNSSPGRARAPAMQMQMNPDNYQSSSARPRLSENTDVEEDRVNSDRKKVTWVLPVKSKDGEGGKSYRRRGRRRKDGDDGFIGGAKKGIFDFVNLFYEQEDQAAEFPGATGASGGFFSRLFDDGGETSGGGLWSYLDAGEETDEYESGYSSYESEASEGPRADEYDYDYKRQTREPARTATTRALPTQDDPHGVIQPNSVGCLPYGLGGGNSAQAPLQSPSDRLLAKKYHSLLNTKVAAASREPETEENRQQDDTREGVEDGPDLKFSGYLGNVVQQGRGEAYPTGKVSPLAKQIRSAGTLPQARSGSVKSGSEQNGSQHGDGKSILIKIQNSNDFSQLTEDTALRSAIQKSMLDREVLGAVRARRRLRSQWGRVICRGGKHFDDELMDSPGLLPRKPPLVTELQNSMQNVSIEGGSGREGKASPGVIDAGSPKPITDLSRQMNSGYATMPGSTTSASNTDRQDVGMEVNHSEDIDATFASPHSVYNMYEYNTGVHMSVQYNEFGDDPRQVFEVIEHPCPPLAIQPFGLVVKVEACTVSHTDCAIRRGDWWNDGSIPLKLPVVPGVSYVGRIHQIDGKSSGKNQLKVGDRVVSLARSGGNSRYIRAEREQLLKVPDELDSACASCLPETYLTAFQVLHSGQKGGLRYRDNSLQGKFILVLGGSSALGRALIEVAIAAGADSVYATAKEKQFASLREMGAIPLNRENGDWSNLLFKRIDIMIGARIDTVSNEEVTSIQLKALSETGQLLVVRGPAVDNSSISTPSSSHSSRLICTSSRNRTMNRTTFYNVFEQWDNNLKECLKDLTHLLELMKQGRLNPKIIERIPLNKVARAQFILESKRLSGFIVCEPWIRKRERGPTS